MKLYLFAVTDGRKIIVNRDFKTKSQLFAFKKIFRDSGYQGRWEESMWEVDIVTGETVKIDQEAA